MLQAEGYHQPYIRTGYEYIIANRTSGMFAYTAKQDGKVVSLSKSGIVVAYKDGSQKGVELGTVYGKAEGAMYPHTVISPLTETSSFKKGDVIAYNTGFFEPDMLDPTKIILKTTMCVKTALFESNQTHEDSSSISQSLSKRLTSRTVKEKSITISFTQNVIEIVKVNDPVEPGDVIIVIEDEITSTSTAFDDESLAALRNLSKQAPRSKYHGTIDRIEVYYHGDKEDMSPSLLALVNKSDRRMADICKSSGRPVITGQVNEEYRVQGVPLALDKAEIKIFMVISTPAGVGDKTIFANQLKSVTGEVMDYKMTTESGEEIEAVFGNRSIAARVVTSPYIMGTTTTLLKRIAQGAYKVYKG